MKLVSDNPDLFNVGLPTEGACDSEHWEKVANRLGLKLEWRLDGKDIMPKRGQAVILGTFWQADDKQMHVVRLLGINGQKLRVMNPANVGSIEEIPGTWVVLIALLTDPTKSGFFSSLVESFRQFFRRFHAA